MRASKFFVISAFLTALGLALLFSPHTFAYDVVTPVSYVDTIYPGAVYYCMDSGLDLVDSGYSCGNRKFRHNGVNRINAAPSGASISGIRYTIGPYSIPSGSILALPFTIQTNGQAMNFTGVTGVMSKPNANNGANYITVLDNKLENVNSGVFRWTVYVKVNNTIPANTSLYFISSGIDGVIATSADTTVYSYNFFWFRDGATALIANNGFIYTPSSSSGGSSFNDSEILAALGSIMSRLDSIASDSSSATISEMNDAIQDIRQQQEDEQESIQDAVDGASDEASSMDTSGWSLANPFATWLSLFGDNTCANIPTIASWIHSNETKVCTPWSSSVRAGTTPIVSILSTTLVFGFIVRWLKQGSSE